MKHKAQESLDILCEHAMVYEEDYDYEENECGEYKNMEERELKELAKPLNELIACQLTVKEIRTIAIAINHLEVDYLLGDLLNSEKKSLKRMPTIRDKLQKQMALMKDDSTLEYL